MEFVFNELSLQGQFGGPEDAQSALRKLLEWRERIRKERMVLRIVRDPRQLLERPLTGSSTVRDIVNGWRNRNLRNITIAWLTKDGPFWDDGRVHGPDDWVECNGQIITDSGLAEAAVSVALGHERDMVSTSPSPWERPPSRCGGFARTATTSPSHSRTSGTTRDWPADSSCSGGRSRRGTISSNGRSAPAPT